jgi:DNA-binding MarR family transcriptional regulator
LGTGSIGAPAIILGVLRAVERDSSVTQRDLARELGIALGLANAYVKRCAKKGYIKIRQAPLHRYAYYVTPRGFAEKSRLTAEYLAVSFDFFRRARSDATALLATCHGQGWTRAVLWGAGEVAEVMILSATEAGVEIIAVVDRASERRSCGGRPLITAIDAALELAGVIDVVIVTDARAPRESFEAAVAAAKGWSIPAERVLAPEMLHLSPLPAAE